MKYLFKLLFIFYLLTLYQSYASEIRLNEMFDGLIEKSFIKTAQNPNITEKCSKILPHLLNATDMLDASSKLQSGIFYGNLYNLGEYDQCLESKHETPDGILQGKYCMISIQIKELSQLVELQREQNLRQMARNMLTHSRDSLMPQIELKMALCIPDVCKLEDITNSLDLLVSSNKLPLTIKSGNCSIDNPDYSAADIIAIIIFSLFGLLLLLSTLYDVVIAPSRRKALLASFSIYSNGNRLLAINPPKKSSDDISCVHGIRALSICWVVLGHRLNASLSSPAINSYYIYTKWVRNVYSTYLTGATVSVDTFFVMSGMLLTYIFLKEMKKTGKFNPVLFYLHRFIRLSPALAAIVLFEATLLIRLRDGPLWEANIGALKNACEKSWWATLLYIQNYYNPDGLCVAQSWYLAVDTQLFWLSPIILLPLWKWPRKTFGFIIIMILASVAIVASIAYKNDYPGAIIDPRDPLMQNMKYVYLPTHTRFGPWLVGVLLGYFLHITKEQRLKMNKFLVLFTWAAVLATAAAVVIGAYPFYKLDGSSTTAENVSFLALHRLAWAICIAWIVFACKNGYGGPVNWILSWGFWQPISRLSYSLYLIHLQLQMVFWVSTRANTNFSDVDIIVNFASDIVLGLGAALVWSLAFESPILIIEKQLLGRNKGERHEENNQPTMENGYVNPAYKQNEQNTNS